MANIRLCLIVFAVALIGYAFYEFRLWKTRGEELAISPKQRKIRVAGFVLLIASLALWYHGTYLPIPHAAPGLTRKALEKQAADYLGYWIFTSVVLLPLVPLALLDTRENIQNALAERRHLREQILGDALRSAPGGTEESS